MGKSVKMKTIVVTFLIAVCLQNMQASPLGNGFADLIRQHLGGGAGVPITMSAGGDSPYPAVRVMGRPPSRSGSFQYGGGVEDNGPKKGRSGGGLFKRKDSTSESPKKEESRGVRRSPSFPSAMPWPRRPW